MTPEDLQTLHIVCLQVVTELKKSVEFDVSCLIDEEATITLLINGCVLYQGRDLVGFIYTAGAYAGMTYTAAKPDIDFKPGDN